MAPRAATSSSGDIAAYDTIGIGYAQYRRPDPRIAATIHEALGSPESVINVGAGSGSYEPVCHRLVAVEPSLIMVRQRTMRANTYVLQGRAEHLPFRAGEFDAAMAVLTMHHWRDWRAGLAELVRVARIVVILTWDPGHGSFWLIRDYFAEILAVDRTIFPPVEDLCDALDGAVVKPVPVPADCTDGFLGAYWARPAAYLDPGVRSAISAFAHVNAEEKLARLAEDLRTGQWHARNEQLLNRTELDVGYRLITTRSAASVDDQRL